MTTQRLLRLLNRRWERTAFRSPERYAVIIARQGLAEAQSFTGMLSYMQRAIA